MTDVGATPAGKGNAVASRYSLGALPSPADVAARLLFSGSQRIDAIHAGNRGLNYGDGLFETMRVHDGSVPLWPRHLARLREGATRLGIDLPDIAFVESRIDETIRDAGDGVLKLLLTRGDGGRGYAPVATASPVWMLSRHPLPELVQGGLRLAWCATRLAIQPALAGIKHCNRLEQVLARAECVRAGADEGLVRDMEGHVVSATSANLLVHRDGRWTTPPVDRAGVAGVLRGWLLEQGLVEAAPLSVVQVESADAVALCNAVRGILQVSSLDARGFAPHPALQALQDRLAMAYPMFSTTAGAA